MALYARKIVLRNCGRFTVVQSDFGADYRTHTHVTSEALYASLTRGATWQPKPVIVKEDSYNFANDYDLSVLPIWFTPGIFLAPDNNYRIPQDALDTTYFNVMHEVFPTTSKSYTFDSKSGELKMQSRPNHTHTYGTWQGIKPDNRLVTYAFASNKGLLKSFIIGQTFLLGKKRTMVQIIDTEQILKGERHIGSCMTPFLQIVTANLGQYQSFEMLTGTVRYIVLRGETQPDTVSIRFGETYIPAFFIPEHLQMYINEAAS